jgi:hypothetical protein
MKSNRFLPLLRFSILWGSMLGCSLVGVVPVKAQQRALMLNRLDRKDENRMRIRNVVRIAGNTRQALYEIQLQSRRVFADPDQLPVLRVGDQKFATSRLGDTSRTTMIFVLTPEEFARVRTGDDVIVAYAVAEAHPAAADKGPLRPWKFGKLDKSKVER